MYMKANTNAIIIYRTQLYIHSNFFVNWQLKQI